MTTENATSKDEQIKAIAKCAKEFVNLDCEIHNFTEMQGNIRARYAVEIRVKEGPVPMNEEEQRKVLSRGLESHLVDLVSLRDALIHQLYAKCKDLLQPNPVV
jgi:hypothetical protein